MYSIVSKLSNSLAQYVLMNVQMPCCLRHWKRPGP